MACVVLSVVVVVWMVLAAIRRGREPFRDATTHIHATHTTNTHTTTPTTFALPTLSGDDEQVRVTPVYTEVVPVDPVRTRLYCDRFDHRRNVLCGRLADPPSPSAVAPVPPILTDVDARDWDVRTQLSLAQTPCMFLVPKFYATPLLRAYPTARFVACLETESVVVCVRAGVDVDTWTDVRRSSRPLTFGYVRGIAGSEVWEAWMREETVERREEQRATSILTRGFKSYETLVEAWQRNRQLDGVYFYGGHPSPFLSGFTERFELHLVDLAPLFDPDDTVGVEMQMTYPHWVRTSVDLFGCVRGRERRHAEHDDGERCYDYHFNTDALVYRTYGFRQLLLATSDVAPAVVTDVVRHLRAVAGGPRLPTVPQDKLPVCPYDVEVHAGAVVGYGRGVFGE